MINLTNPKPLTQTLQPVASSCLAQTQFASNTCFQQSRDRVQVTAPVYDIIMVL